MTKETKVVEQRIVQRFIKTIADYEEGGEFYSQVIPLNTQAFAIYDLQEKSGLYYVLGDGSHTYIEIREGQSSLESSHEYAVFSDTWITLINSKADLQYMNYELAKRQLVSNLVTEITEENEKSTTLYPSNKAVSTLANILQANLDQEITNRQNVDTALSVSIEEESSRAINKEDQIIADYTTADSTLSTNINTLRDDLVAEKIRAETAESSLQETKADKSELPTKTSELTNDSDFTTNTALQEQVAVLTQQIKDLKLLIPTEVTDSSTARSAMTKPGKVTLVDDIDLGVLNISGGTFASNDTTINLNGYEIKAGPTGGRAMLLARGTSKYTFNGRGRFVDTASDSSPVWCANVNASITINNGTFIAQGHTETIYCELGTITINGGEFKTEMEDKRYLLNCKDANYKAGTANIIVKGGEFWDFDPSANPEGPDTSYVAEGYTVISREEDSHIIYTVVKA